MKQFIYELHLDLWLKWDLCYKNPSATNDDKMRNVTLCNRDKILT